MPPPSPLEGTPESLVGQFQLERILNQGNSTTPPPMIISHVHRLTIVFLRETDQAGRRITLYGFIASKPSILILERTVFPSSPADISSLTHGLSQIKNLGHNDIYNWYLAASPSSSVSSTSTSESDEKSSSSWMTFADLKINLIHPCTEAHLKKYSQQGYRLVTETPEIYRERVRPYMKARRDGGRLDWVWNILEGRAEQEDVLLRVHHPEAGFLLTPDL